MNGYTDIFKVIMKNHDDNRTIFVQVFKTLKGAIADFDRRKATLERFGCVIRFDDTYCTDPEKNVAKYRMMGFNHSWDLNSKGLFLHIEKDNLYE